MTSQEETNFRIDVLAGIRLECTKNTHRVQHLVPHLTANLLADEKLAEDAKQLWVLDGRIDQAPCKRAERRLVLLVGLAEC